MGNDPFHLFRETQDRRYQRKVDEFNMRYTRRSFAIAIIGAVTGILGLVVSIVALMISLS